MSDAFKPLSRGQRATLAIILAVAFGLGLYDFAAAAHAGTAVTISWVLTKVAMNNPAVAFGFGFLMGHLFAPQHEVPDIEGGG